MHKIIPRTPEKRQNKGCPYKSDFASLSSVRTLFYFVFLTVHCGYCFMPVTCWFSDCEKGRTLGVAGWYIFVGQEAVDGGVHDALVTEVGLAQGSFVC